MASVSKPVHISSAAQAYYGERKSQDLAGIDLRTTAGAEALRSIAYPGWRETQAALEREVGLERTVVDGVPAGWVRGEFTGQENVLLHLHGGGYVLGDVEVRSTIALAVVRAGGAPTLTLGYRLAPEHPFPAALEDALRGYEHLLGLGYAPEQIGVFGESAGGGLALALALTLRDRGHPVFGAVALVSPWTDLELSGDSGNTIVSSDPDQDAWGVLEACAAAYATTRPLNDPLLSPVHANLEGMPPMLIQVGAREVFLSDSLRIARRAREAGVAVTLDVWDGMWHVFHSEPELPESKQASAEIAAFFASQLDGSNRST